VSLGFITVVLQHNWGFMTILTFAPENSGGEDIILQLAGQDATEAFDEVGHSKDAHDQLEELFVGVLKQEVRYHSSHCIRTWW
jgi:cytochrome b involved in lipid metabolism